MNYPEIKLLIDGQWVASEKSIAVINPATEAVVGHIPHASAADIANAIAGAARGLRVWKRMAPAERAAILLKAAQLMRAREARIAHATVLEQGKSLAAAAFEVRRAAAILEWDANQGLRQYGQVVPLGPELRCMVRREPIGVVAGFSPWNAPIGSPMRKIAAALSAGCALILKPAEETPAGAFHIAQALVDAGLPPGVLNVLFGDPGEISRTLVESDSVRMLTFTGSVAVGRQLAQMAAARLKPCLLELGGHAPVIVCADTDPVAVARLAVKAKANNTGQICVSPTRFFVAENIFDAFVQAFSDQARAVVCGDGLPQDGLPQEGLPQDGLPQDTHIGPLTNARRRQDIERLVDDARTRGARVLCGGERPAGKGYFYPLTVLADVPEGAQVLREEPFGPIAIINRFSQLDAAIAQANALNVGLAAYAFSNNADVQEQLAAQIEAGSLAINTFTVSSAETPFGGIKDSGYGREGGAHSLDAYTVVKSVMQASHAQVLA